MKERTDKQTGLNSRVFVLLRAAKKRARGDIRARGYQGTAQRAPQPRMIQELSLYSEYEVAR